uniref:Uncharacterized protein n=1 Tax=Brassica oleracea var. oleracea TaxID=109376 RepID=A0A0D3CT41_BRAOL
MFRRRFRMGRPLFLCIYDAIQRHDKYFFQRRDGAGKLGLSGLQKITAAFRILAYGLLADSTNEYIKIGESTALESLKRFYRVVVEVFGSHYLRSPDVNDVARLLHIGERQGFPEDERDINATIEEQAEVPNAEVEMTSVDDARFQEFLARHNKIKDRDAHFELEMH